MNENQPRRDIKECSEGNVCTAQYTKENPIAKPNVGVGFYITLNFEVGNRDNKGFTLNKRY